MTWNDESETVRLERVQQSRNPHHATTTATRAERDYEEGEIPTPCGLGRCYHRAHGMDCPDDPWAGMWAVSAA